MELSYPTHRSPSIALVIALAALAPVSAARADPPATTIYFGAPVIPTVRVLARAEIPAPEAPPAPECPRAVTVARRMDGSTERASMPLVDCEGRVREDARQALSILARPRGRAAPTDEEMRRWRETSGASVEHLAQDVRLLHPALLLRLQRIGEAFEGGTIEIVSGFRPRSPRTSRHHHGRALDLRVAGVSREAVRDLAASFEQTGVGWYPNSTFVHVDVREESAYWVDLSRPGERARYVRGASPPSAEGSATEAGPTASAGTASPGTMSDARATDAPIGSSGEEREAEDEGPPPSDDELREMRLQTDALLRSIRVPLAE